MLTLFPVCQRHQGGKHLAHRQGWGEIGRFWICLAGGSCKHLCGDTLLDCPGSHHGHGIGSLHFKGSLFHSSHFFTFFFPLLFFFSWTPYPIFLFFFLLLLLSFFFFFLLCNPKWRWTSGRWESRVLSWRRRNPPSLIWTRCPPYIIFPKTMRPPWPTPQNGVLILWVTLAFALSRTLAIARPFPSFLTLVPTILLLWLALLISFHFISFYF